MDESKLENIYVLDDVITFELQNETMSSVRGDVRLSYSESRVFFLLIKHQGETVPREILVSFAWPGRVVTDSSLAKSISNIRKNLKALGIEEDIIATIPRIGYRLTCLVRASWNSNVEEPTGHYTDKIFPLYEYREEVNKHDYHNGIIFNKVFFNRLSKVLFLFSGLVMLLLATYNIMWKIGFSLEKNFIAEGYQVVNVNLSGKNYILVKDNSITLTHHIKELISIAPESTIVFLKLNQGIYNLSYTIGREKSLSFVFNDKNIGKAKCQITHVFMKDSTCIM